jgi:hypothetical protein
LEQPLILGESNFAKTTNFGQIKFEEFSCTALQLQNLFKCEKEDFLCSCLRESKRDKQEDRDTGRQRDKKQRGRLPQRQEDRKTGKADNDDNKKPNGR